MAKHKIDGCKTTIKKRIWLFSYTNKATINR